MCLTSLLSKCLFESETEGAERPLLGSGMGESWTNSIDCGLVTDPRRIKARKIGIDAATTDIAGSAVPKIFRSTVVAVTPLDFNLATKTPSIADLQLLSVMSEREIIFIKATMPELEQRELVSVCSMQVSGD